MVSRSNQEAFTREPRGGRDEPVSALASISDVDIEVSPPSVKPLLSRGETRPVFGSPAVRISRAPDLWLCVPASRPVCLYRKNAFTYPYATTMPSTPRPYGATLDEQNHDDGPSVRLYGSSLCRRARDMSSSWVLELTPLPKTALGVRFQDGIANSLIGAEDPPTLGALHGISIAPTQIARLIRLRKGVELGKMWRDFRRPPLHHQVDNLGRDKNRGQETARSKRRSSPLLEIHGAGRKVAALGALGRKAQDKLDQLPGKVHVVTDVKVVIEAHPGRREDVEGAPEPHGRGRQRMDPAGARLAK